jgi:hypothetical protein
VIALEDGFKSCEVKQAMLLSGAAIQDSIVLVRKEKQKVRVGARVRYMIK